MVTWSQPRSVRATLWTCLGAPAQADSASANASPDRPRGEALKPPENVRSPARAEALEAGRTLAGVLVMVPMTHSDTGLFAAASRPPTTACRRSGLAFPE